MDALKIGWLLHPNLRPLLAHGTAVFLAVIAAVIFAESGLLIGFFLPGDSLLFAAGLVAALSGHPSVFLLVLVVFVAAAAGDQVGYMFGARVGPSLFTRPDSRLFKQENVAKARVFFDRHGSRALVLARFVPVVRTFTPILAGVSKMPYRRFVTYNLVGAALWSVFGTLLGYGLGKRFPKLESYLTPVILVVVGLSFIPIAFEVLRARRAKSAAPNSEPTEQP